MIRYSIQQFLNILFRLVNLPRFDGLHGALVIALETST